MAEAERNNTFISEKEMIDALRKAYIDAYRKGFHSNLKAATDKDGRASRDEAELFFRLHLQYHHNLIVVDE